MRSVTFHVPGVPNAKAKRIGMVRGHARAYNDERTTTYQGLVCMAAAATGVERFEGPVVLRVVAVFPRLPSQCRLAKRDGRLLGGWLAGRIPLASKPDFDNIAKAVCDGITRAGLWTDDARVVDGRVIKVRAAIDEAPHTEVTVREWTD
jgi:Holliday junction resolvase RusA-like endonuclease